MEWSARRAVLVVCAVYLLSSPVGRTQVRAQDAGNTPLTTQAVNFAESVPLTELCGDTPEPSS